MEIVETRNHEELARLNETVQSWHQLNFPNEFKPYNYQEVLTAFEKLLLNDNCIAFIALSDGISVGYLLAFIERRPDSVFQFEKKFFNIDQIFVVDSYRKQGVGKLLLDSSISFARRKGISEVQLNHWSGNKAAENFFVKNGFDYFNHKMKRHS